MNLTNYWNVGINLSDADTVKLKTIVDDLVDSKAVNSSDIEDFLRFTVFIVFDEYEKNKDSLRKFYRLNLEKYIANKSAN